MAPIKVLPDPKFGTAPQPLLLSQSGVGTGNLKPLIPESRSPIQLQNATQQAPGAVLRSSTSIPMPGEDHLPDDFDELKMQLGLAEKREPSMLESFGRGLADIALQPARFIERAGKALGNVGAKFGEQIYTLRTGKEFTQEQRDKVRMQTDEILGPGLQQRGAEFLLGKDQAGEYATPAYKNTQEVVGGGLQAAANLATPLVGSVPGMALQGAAVAGGKALENNRPLSEAAFDATVGGVASAALGSLLGVGGAVIGRGFRAAAPEIARVFKPIADKLGPTLTGTTRQEFSTAFKQAPHVLLDYLNTVKNAGSPAEAEGILQGRLVENIRKLVGEAKTVEGNAFKQAADTFNKSFPDVKVDVHASANRLLDDLPQFGLPRNADEEFALTQVQKILQKPREFTVDGTRTLLQDLFAFADGLEEGSPAERLAMKAWADVRDELAKATKAADGGAFEQAMARYSNFKDQTNQLRQLNSKNEDTVRSFVRNLSGTNKTASRDALIKLQEMSGLDEDAAASIQIYNLMKRLAADGKVTGSRMQDVMLSGGMVSGAGAIGSLFGPGGAALGATLGSLLSAKALAPATITNVMLSEIRAAGIPVTNQTRQLLEQVIKNPALRQAVIDAAVNGMNSKKEPVRF